VLDTLKTGGLCPASCTSAGGTIDPELALQAGRILGHYRIRGKLGGGTFGTVFAAWDLRLERMVALKVLKRNLFESRDAVLAEARAAAKLNHPHVCTSVWLWLHPLHLALHQDAGTAETRWPRGLRRPNPCRISSARRL
jgi:serine/threonine protein kinase